MLKKAMQGTWATDVGENRTRDIHGTSRRHRHRAQEGTRPPPGPTRRPPFEFTTLVHVEPERLDIESGETKNTAVVKPR
jgi:hypothetical protein